MGTTKTCLLYFLCACFSVGLYGQNGSVKKEPQAPKGDMKTVQGIYSAEVGTKELTGHNDGKRVEEYLASCNLKRGQPWCAAFVCWTFKKAGIKAIVSGYSPNWFTSKYVIYFRGKKNNLIPQTADVGGIFFADKGRIAHTFFIDEWPPGSSTTITVEGNTNSQGSREGEGCYRKRRLKTQIYKVSRYI